MKEKKTYLIFIKFYFNKCIRAFTRTLCVHINVNSFLCIEYVNCQLKAVSKHSVRIHRATGIPTPLKTLVIKLVLAVFPYYISFVFYSKISKR